MHNTKINSTLKKTLSAIFFIAAILVAAQVQTTPTPIAVWLPTPTPTPTPTAICTPTLTVTEGDLSPGGETEFIVTAGSGTVSVKPNNNGTGLQSLTIVGGSSTVYIPPFALGSQQEVVVTFTDASPDFTLRAASKYHAAYIVIKCNTMPTPVPKAIRLRTTTPKPTEGSMIRNPKNPHRWLLNGKPFYPIGIGDCIGTHGSGVLTGWGFDGGKTDIDTYLKAYSDAGFNMFRWSVNNCSFKLDSNEANWITGDTLARKLRQYGFHIMFVFFNDVADSSPEGLAYIKKAIDRYGQFVDVWEISNETMDSDAKLTILANYIKENDSYRRPVTSSVRQKGIDLPSFDVVSPHWYYPNDTDFTADIDAWNNIIEWKRYGKPVIVGESGNQTANWDGTSAMRMRLRSWTAFFAEGAVIFWNTSSSKTYKGSPANIYLGTEERSFIRVLQDFTTDIPADAGISSIKVNQPSVVRGYALRAAGGYFAYLHNFTNHKSYTYGITVTVDLPIPGKAAWIEPSTGRILGSTDVSAGKQTLTVPPFLIDTALKVINSSSPVQ